jgi:peptidoglycan L-alanyl-D-glutamate endopeptidase CwlK
MSFIEDIWKIQKWAGVKQDGLFGPISAAAVVKKLGLDTLPPAPAPIPGTLDALLEDDTPVDERSEKNIATLLPPVQPIARALVRAAAQAGITIKVISGTRTYAEQDALYAKGRTAPGPKVTNARGGYSNHNFGIAFDIGIFEGNSYIPESPLYRKVGQLGKLLGLLWGGDWTSFKDEPHFEYNPHGYSLADLRELKEEGNSPV